MRGSVRFRTTATALVVVGTALVLAAVMLLVLLRDAMQRNVDAQARIRLHDVIAKAQTDPILSKLAGDDDGTVAQVILDDRVLAQSPIIRGNQPIAAFTPTGPEMMIRTVRNPPIADGETYRVAAQRIDTPRGPAVAYVAATLEPVYDTMYELAILLAVFIPMLIVLVGVTTWRLVGRTLEPVDAIRRQVAEISASELDRRVPVPATDDEIDRLARTMNAMLDRLEASARRQRSFIADASHELRSPMTIIRTKLEVGLARSESADWPLLVRGWLDQQGRLERLVEDLLLLARVDEGVPIMSPSIVDLDELVLREARDLRARGKVRVDVAQVGGGRVRGDAEQLRRVVGNLLDNAERHATSTVRCVVFQDGDIVELVVSDDGPGIELAERGRIFERFIRLDQARNRGSGGAGLGLAIVRDIVNVHGGTVEVSDGARFTVRLPAEEPAATPTTAHHDRNRHDLIVPT